MARMRAAALAATLAVALATASAAAGTPPPDGRAPIGVQRAEGFIEVLGAAPEQRRKFVEANFTADAIARRGLDGLVEFLGEVHRDIGSNKPSRVEAFADRVEFAMVNADGEKILFTVAIDAGPEQRIRGLRIGPDEAASPPPPSVAEAGLPAAIAALVAEARAKGFTGQVLVARRGEELFAQAHGEADRASHRALDLDTPVNLASNNKMFTALLIGQLVEEGKLDWDDPVGKHLSDWPQAAVREKVTIAHLLTHTSGLGDYWGPAHQARVGTLDTVAEYAELVHADVPADEPGKAFKYSNNGFVLLGLIAEKATGRDYYELVRERIYRRAGMTRAEHYPSTDTKAGFAVGYLADGSSSAGRIALRGSPAGGGYASARDLHAFANALLAGKIVRPDTLARITTGHAPMGPDMAYGYGFGVTSSPEKHFGHDGGTPGTNSSFELFPDSGYVVIVQSNTGNGSQPLARRLIALLEARKRG